LLTSKDEIMLSNEFKINKVDKVYVKIFVIVCLYMCDILILDNNDHMIKSTKKILTNKFDTKDFGVVDVILEIKISKISDGLILFQSHYVEKTLNKFSKGDNNTIRTPIDTSVHLSKIRDKRTNLEYSRIIESLMYSMNYTKPDIGYSVSKLGRFISNPSINH